MIECDYAVHSRKEDRTFYRGSQQGNGCLSCERREGLESRHFEGAPPWPEQCGASSIFRSGFAESGACPSPKQLWLGERGQEVRQYFEKKTIPVYVNGLDGTIRVTFKNDSYQIVKMAR